MSVGEILIFVSVWIRKEKKGHLLVVVLSCKLDGMKLCEQCKV